MHLVFAILMWLLAFSLLLVLVAAFMPLRIELNVDKTDTWRYALAWRAFGRFGPRVQIQGRKKPKKTASDTAVEKPTKRRFGQRMSAVGLVHAVLRLVTDLLRCIRLDSARLDLRFGTGDPAETGQIFGMITPFIYGTVANPKTRFCVAPDFDNAVFTGHGHIALSVIPASLLPPLARFGWTAFGARP